MRRRLKRVAPLALVILLLAPTPPVLGQAGIVEDIHVQGLFRMTDEAFRHAFGIRVGDPYDPVRIRAEFRKLWDLGLFEDIVVEAEDGPKGGKVLIIKLKERPELASVEYGENKVLSTTQIEDRLKERDVRLQPGQPMDMKAVYAAASTIREYLAEKGYLDAEVRHHVQDITETSKGVTFTIRPHGKTRIRKIDFVGNKVFKDRKLKDQLKATRAWRWYWPWSAKYLYHPIKWDQDAGGIRELYQNRGYLDVEIGPPRLEFREVDKSKKKKKKQKKNGEQSAVQAEDSASAAGESQGKTQVAEQGRERDESAEPGPGRPDEDLTPRQRDKLARKERKKQENARKKKEKAQRKAESKVRRWVYLTVPVTEGPQYRTGKITVSGNTFFKDEELLSRVPLREGAILSEGILKLGIELITRAYNDRGYAYAKVVRQIERHEDEPIADVHVTVDEDAQYFIGRIEFAGNTGTHDRVLRRELRLKEGELFNRTQLDLSVRKLTQLGYWVPTDQPVIEPIEDEKRVRITVPGQEKGRNQIQVGGGYSGLDGAFFTGFYSTRNFLGRGQIFSTSLQVGGRANRYSISFVEPWFMSRPIQLGFSLFRRDIDFGGNLRSSGRGGGVVLGRQFGLYNRVVVNYNFESLTSTGFSVTGAEATNRVSSVTPSFEHNRINNPYRPSRGWSLLLNTQVAGGFLGGDTNFIRPLVFYTAYRRALRRSFFGFHAEVGLIRTFQGGTTANTATVNGVPRFQRFWIGGDAQGPRVFEIRTVTPLRFVRLDSQGRIVEAIRDPTGRPVGPFDRDGDGILNGRDLVELGGDRFFLLQSEYVLPLSDQAELAFFFDVGNSLFEDTPWGFDDARMSAGVELRFFLPVFPVPLRLIYGIPIRKLEQDRTSNFTFSIGKSF